MENEKNQMNIEIRPEVARGNYSNLAIISHSHSEFIIDFATLLPGLGKTEVSNRIVMNPENAKRLMLALNENIAKFESNFGRIELQGMPSQQPQGTFNLADFNLNGKKS